MSGQDGTINDVEPISAKERERFGFMAKCAHVHERTGAVCVLTKGHPQSHEDRHGNYWLNRDE